MRVAINRVEVCGSAEDIVAIIRQLSGHTLPAESSPQEVISKKIAEYPAGVRDRFGPAGGAPGSISFMPKFGGPV